VAENGYGISWIVPQLTTKRTKSFRRQIYGKRILFAFKPITQVPQWNIGAE